MTGADRSLAISFDAVGTFMHLVEPVAETYARFARAHELTVDVSIIAGRLEYALREAPSMVPPPGSDVSAFARAWWRAIVAQALNVPEQDARLQKCFDSLFAWYGSPGAWRINPAFGDLLAHLCQGGVKLAIISNFDARLRRLLEAFGLSTHFDAVVLPHEAGAQKPDAAIFRWAAAALNVPLPGMWHLGDDEHEDVRGARCAGLHALRWTFPLDADGAQRAGDRLLACLPKGSGYRTDTGTVCYNPGHDRRWR